MSNLFYDFLSEKIIKYFQINTPAAGEKFYVQFESEEQVKNLYSVLKNNVIAAEFVYEDLVRSQVYKTYELNFGGIQLIVAAAMQDGPHPDFLATMRNLVGVEENYLNKAILFIHCSSLDSILGGAGSLAKEGMPLNISVIERDIKRRINETGYTATDKTILEQYLENKRRELDGTTASIFEYEDIIQCLSDSQITADEYKKFELFPDETLSTLTGKKLKARLADNHTNYIKIAEIHSYGADNAKLENTYGEEGAKALSKENWESISFTEIEKFIANKKNKSTIEYLPFIVEKNIWDREEGDTKAKNRIRNIIVFVDDVQDSVQLTLNFTEYTKSVGIDIPKAYKSILSCTNGGKKLFVTISDIEDKAYFCQLKYSDNGVKFDFKIAVLRCAQSILEDVKTQYSVEIKGADNSAIRINTEDDIVTFNSCGSNDNQIKINENNQVVPISYDDKLEVTISEDYPYLEDNEDVYFSLSTEKFVIPIIKAFAIEKPTVIEGLKLWYLKHIRQSDFVIQGDNSLVLGTKKYYTRDEFRFSLDLEKKYIQNGAPFVIEKSFGGQLENVEVSLPNAVKNAFDNIIQYYISKNEIPSLVFVTGKIEELYKEYISAVLNEVKAISEGSYLTEEQKGLFYLGMVKRQYGDQEILLSPLHPINIAYQLYINTQEIAGLEDEEFDLLRKFQQTSLMPYINIDPYSKEKKIYMPIEQIHSPEWKVYVDEALPRYKGSKNFVSKLVAEKMREFVEHFSYLFSTETRTALKINLINTGDCREIVQGIIKYYAKELNASGNKQVLPIQVTMYAESKMDNAFEKMSQIDDVENLVKVLGLSDIKVNNMSIDDVIDVYRSNVNFYFKNIDDEFEYAHVTFMELDDDHQAISTVMQDIPSGVVMNGMVSSVPSEMLGDSYRTGFGIKYANLENDVLKMAVSYNAINASMNGDSYRDDVCLALKMGLNKQKILDRLYDASNWVTFINPKVDLNYFKSDPSAKDLLIIHYSDQYNMTSSGYDAITVTKKSRQYQNAICRYLSANGVDDVQRHSKDIINMFNALNGDWLLRMLSYKSHFPVEKLSILSAMKLATKRYSVENVVWIPVSLEEILRVSGSVGLSQKGAILSAKNLGFEGQTSDDLLLVGISDGDTVQVTFYPIEVKIGKVETGYLEKGVKQALRTREIFDTILKTGSCMDKDIKTRLYRNFFMQQVMVNAGKMQLYEVGDTTQNWDLITDSDLRRKLLNEEYVIVDSLIPEMGKAGVISFREECQKEREFRNQDVLIVEKTKKEGVNLLSKSFNDIASVEWDLVKDALDLSQDDSSDLTDEENDTTSNEIINEEDNDSAEPETTDEVSADSIRVLIGEDKYNHSVCWEFGNKALANRHLLITGTSGQGKTYSIQTMLYELNKHNISAVIFDYTEGFMVNQLEEPFKNALNDSLNQHIVYSFGVPINPFKRHEIDLAGQKILEKESQVAARLADIFAHVYDFGAQQYAAIFDAALNGMYKYGNSMNMKYFQDELNEVVEQNKSAKSVISKMSPFFHTVEFVDNPDFDWGSILYADEAKVNIMQLTLFTREMQVAITELMLWDAWYYTKKYGSKDKPFVVVLDEAQNLSHTMKSPSAAILTEGRKFGWSAWFATQSLKVLRDDEVVRLLQSAFKLYFKPTDDEMVKISKQLDATGETNWLPEIQKLKKGQCIAVGDKMKPNGTVGPAAPTVVNVSSFENRK